MGQGGTKNSGRLRLRGPEGTEASLRKICQTGTGPLRMRQAVRFQAGNAIPKHCDTLTSVKGLMCRHFPTGRMLDSVAMLTSASSKEQWKCICMVKQVILRVQYLHSTHCWGFKLPLFQTSSNVILWTGCQMLVCNQHALEVLVECICPFSFI